MRTQKLLPYMFWRILPLAMVLLGAILYVFFILSEGKLEEQVDKQLQNQMSFSAHILEARFQNLEDALQNVAGNELVINSLIDMEKRAEYLPTFIDSLRLPGPQNPVISILDYRGRVIHSNAVLGADYKEPYFEEIIHSQTFIHTNEEGFVLGAPIFYNGFPEGALVVHYDFQHLQDIARHTVSTGRYAVLDERGQIVTGVLSFLLKHGFDEFHQDDGVLVHSKILEGSGGLRLVNFIEKEEALAPVRDQYQFMMIGALVMFVIVMAAVVMAVVAVSQPLSRLGRQLSTIHKHEDLRRQIDMFGPVEIREIAQAINRANARLHKENEERQLLEMRLRQGQKLEAMGTLAGGVAHEINTPVQYIGDNLKFLEDSVENIREMLLMSREIVTKADQHELSETHLKDFKEKWNQDDLDFVIEEIPDAIHQSFQGAKQITHIVNAMKEFSHPNSNEMSLTRLADLVENALTLSRNEWKHVAKIRVKLHEPEFELKCLSSEMRQVFLNLIVNSAHAIEEKSSSAGGEIEISSELGEGFVDLIFRDNGCGIPEDRKDRIFDPFFTTKDVGKGSGQGLSIVHDIITNKHSGDILVKSRQGVGTVITLRIPTSNHLKYRPNQAGT